MDFKRIVKLKELEEKLDYRFSDMSLLNVALTHTSYVKGDGKAKAHNERLEFLGDAVLELCISEYLYKTYNDYNEGDMTKVRASTVCEESLYAAAKKLELGELLQLGRGEDNSGGRDKPSILSDAFEAVIGALYIDGGMETARTFIIDALKNSVDEAVAGRRLKDYKTMLQEYVQKQHMGNISYELVGSSGPDHNKTFIMSVKIGSDIAGEGEGKTKQEAGQQAARLAMISLGILDK